MTSSSSTSRIYIFPEYLSHFLTLLQLLAFGLFGYALLQKDLLDLTAAALVSIYFITGAYIEERRLVSTFGDRYRKYQQGRHIETWMISELGVSSKAPFRGLLLSSDCSAPGITPL